MQTYNVHMYNCDSNFGKLVLNMFVSFIYAHIVT